MVQYNKLFVLNLYMVDYPKYYMIILYIVDDYIDMYIIYIYIYIRKMKEGSGVYISIMLLGSTYLDIVISYEYNN